MEKQLFNYAIKIIKPIMIGFSLLIFFRGHNEPGGGFIGGLIASTAFILGALAEGPDITRLKLRIPPLSIAATGMLISLLSGLPGLLTGGDFMQGLWVSIQFPFELDVKLGTPLLFDFGVYLTVIGFTLTVILNLMEVWKWK